MKTSAEVIQRIVKQGTSVVCALVLILFPLGVPVAAQEQYPYSAPPPQYDQGAQLLSPEQLDNLVAPIALYPDALLGQVLVASTYPAEIQQAAQWLQQMRGMQGPQLMEAAQQQNWDPSIQALVAFPDVIGRLASNANWTSDLGNAFLAQEADVMNAVQRMRAQAQAAGRLTSNSQQQVMLQQQDGQNVIEIVPADPQVMYVPQYNPEYIWGPPAWGYYPSLYYPSWGFGFGSGIFIGSYFGGWGGGWGGWGWRPNWYGHTIITNGGFFSRYGFHNYYGGGFGRGGVWVHNPSHRLGVPYVSRGLATRFGGRYDARGFGSRYQGGQGFGRVPQDRRVEGNARSFQGNGTSGGGWRHFGEPNTGVQRGGFGGGNRMQAPPSQGNSRSFAPQQAPNNPGFNSPGRNFNGQGRSAPEFRQQAPNPAGGGFNPGRSFGNAGRSAPEFRQQAPAPRGGFNNPGRSFNSPAPSAPAFRSAPSGGQGRSFGGGRPSFGGGGGGGARSFGGGGGGGGFHGGGGGGGSHGGGGGHRR
jgi:hypothetical protein